jgi:hypothetical protein
MSEYTFLPKNLEDVARLVAERVKDLFEGIVEPEKNHRFPPWVRKMGASIRQQSFSAQTSQAFAAKDEIFIIGFLGGMMMALQHFMQNAPKEHFIFAWMVGVESAARIDAKQTEALPDCIKAGYIFQVPEIREKCIGMIDALPTIPPNDRRRLFEGIIAGSDLEEFIKNGPLRPGLALDTQIVMLLFWPEIEAMKTRREAYEFVQFLHRDTPAAQRSEEAFIRLAKDYGFKSRKSVKGG